VVVQCACYVCVSLHFSTLVPSQVWRQNPYYLVSVVCSCAFLDCEMELVVQAYGDPEVLCRPCVDCGLMTGRFYDGLQQGSHAVFVQHKTVYQTRNGQLVRARRCAAPARTCLEHVIFAAGWLGALRHHRPGDRRRSSNEIGMAASDPVCRRVWHCGRFQLLQYLKLRASCLISNCLHRQWPRPSTMLIVSAAASCGVDLVGGQERLGHCGLRCCLCTHTTGICIFSTTCFMEWMLVVCLCWCFGMHRCHSSVELSELG